MPQIARIIALILPDRSRQVNRDLKQSESQIKQMTQQTRIRNNLSNPIIRENPDRIEILSKAGNFSAM